MRERPDTILTKDELARRNQRLNAITDLRERGIVVDPHGNLTLEQVEALAEVVKGWES